MFKNKCIFLILSVFILSACNKASNATAATFTGAGAIIELPATVLGVFTGTLMGTSNDGKIVTSQFANATISKNGNDISISFSGGIPRVDVQFPSIKNLQFVKDGSDNEYKSNAANGSVAGIHLVAYKTNLNIENVYVNGINIIYTGVKCDVVPEVPVCICVTNPSNLMCQNK